MHKASVAVLNVGRGETGSAGDEKAHKDFYDTIAPKMRSYEIVEHTAEIGIRAYGRTRKELFAHMAQGMYGLIVPQEEVKKRSSISVRASAEGWDRLLVAWLRELIFLFDTKHFLGRSFEIRSLTGTQLEAKVSGEKLEPRRHSVDKEVKAVTYCELSLGRRKDGFWSAQVIFDI